MSAKFIIEKNIENFKQTLHNHDEFSSFLVHSLIGQITMAVELNALSWNEAEQYIDEVLRYK